MDELCDESRFEKTIHGGQIELRRVVKDGLFTVSTNEESWGRAHRILMPGFGKKAMDAYLPVMNSVARSMVENWSDTVGTPINVGHYMAMVSLEIIGVCGFDYHFADFSNYQEHPLATKIKSVLMDANLSTVFPDFWMNVLFATGYRRKRNIRYIHNVVDDVIAKRLNDPEAYSDKQDFLSLMLDGVDRKDGSKLDEENIRYQLITFLVAGSETTSSLLGFCLYYLMKNDVVMRKARAAVDEVFDCSEDQQLTFKDLSKLSYLRMVINEALRLWPTATGFFLKPKEKTTLNGAYDILEDDVLFISLPGLHRDVEIWGSRPDEFTPENFSPENIKNRPKNAFKPFGNGMRACIGRHFAITEAQVVLAHILHRFNLVDYKNYQLKIEEMASLKVKNFNMLVTPRRS